MAQKTPVPALTIALSGTWTSLWYYEFSDLQASWASNLQLHYLAGAYFAAKRRLMHRFAILQNNQRIYVNAQLVRLTTKTLKRRSRKKRVKGGLVAAKRLRRTRLVAQKVKALTRVMVSSTCFWNYKRSFPRLKKARQWFLRQPTFGGPNITTTSPVLNSIYLNVVIKPQSKKLVKTQSQSLLILNKKRPRPLVFRAKRAKRGFQKRRFFRTDSSRNFFLPGIVTTSTKLSSAVIETTSNLFFKHISALNPTTVVESKFQNLTPSLARSLYRRWRQDWKRFGRLRPRKQRHFLEAYVMLQDRRQGSRLLQTRFKRRMLKLSLLRQACQHVTRFPVVLNLRHYVCRIGRLSKLKHRSVFRRWGRQPFFLPTVSLVALSLMRGSCSLLMNWLVRLLKKSKKHSSILFLISVAFKYFLHQPDSSHLIASLPCAGVRFEVVGKIDGQDRAKTFRCQVGAIPTSTLRAPLDTEYAAVVTIYGVLGLTLWYFMKSTPIRTVLPYAAQPSYLPRQPKKSKLALIEAEEAKSKTKRGKKKSVTRRF